MDYKLWAQLNLVGHVSLEAYWQMGEDEAMACLQALHEVIEESQSEIRKKHEVAAKKQQSLNLLAETENKYKRARDGQ